MEQNRYPAITMIIPATTRNRFFEEQALRASAFESIKGLVAQFCDTQGYAYLGRLKSLESTAEKIESGRFAKWSDLDDLMACTVIVPTILDEENVLSFCQERLVVVRTTKRGELPKPSDVFRFDSTRVRCRLAKPEGLNTGGLSIFDQVFEIQIKTAFEHAWSVSTHKLVYKSDVVDWRRLRLAAQIKASVEQLDTLILAYEDAAERIPTGSWPEVDRKKRIVERVSSWIQTGAIPSELAPKDYSRLADNFYSLLLHAGLEEKTRQALNVIDRVVTSTPIDRIPRSISLFQYLLAILITNSFFASSPIRRFHLHITPELVNLFPDLPEQELTFDYNQ